MWGLRGTARTPWNAGVPEVVECFPNPVEEGDGLFLFIIYLFLIPHNFQFASGLSCMCFWVGVVGFEESWQHLPIRSRRHYSTLTAACKSLELFSLKASETKKPGRVCWKHQWHACEAVGIWGRIHIGRRGRERARRKVEMLPGAPNRRQTI